MPETLWAKQYEDVPYFDSIRVRRKVLDSRLGPFGGGWTTKFGLLVGTTRHIVYFWKWSIDLYLE